MNADFVFCRHVLNAVTDPREFVSNVRRGVEGKPLSLVYFEVPHALFTFKNGLVWNIVHEHKSWFTAESLSY